MVERRIVGKKILHFLAQDANRNSTIVEITSKLNYLSHLFHPKDKRKSVLTF